MFWAEETRDVAGKSSRLDAKIGGITPDMLSLNGRWLVWPAYMRRPDLALRIVHRDTALRALDEHHEQRHAEHDMIRSSANGPAHFARAHHVQRVAEAPGRPATMPARMIMEMPLPMPRSVICSPSHIRNRVPVVIVMVAVKSQAAA